MATNNTVNNTSVTQSPNNNSTKIATTAYVDAGIAAIGASGLVFLASATAANSATVNFDNLLTSTYDNYLITIEKYLPVTSTAALKMRFGTGATPTYQATSYRNFFHAMNVQGFNPIASATTSLAITTTDNINTTSTITGSAIIWIFGANDSVGNKKYLSNAIYNTAATIPDQILLASGGWASATVITSVQFFCTTGNISTGVFKLYGLKN